MPSVLEVFQTFLYVGATAFGGGGSAHIQNAVVTRRMWLSEDEFLECSTLSQTLPGPIFSNLAAQVGSRLAGWRGGVAACIAVSLPGAMLILLLALVYSRLPTKAAWLEGLLTGIGAGAVGISLSMLARIAPSAAKSRGGWLLGLVAFGLNGILHISVLWVLLVLLPAGIWLNTVKPPPLETPKPAQLEAPDA